MARRRRRSSARRRNPLSLGRALSNPLAVAKPAIIGAAGALAVNGIVNYAPLPDVLKTGNTVYLTKAGIALLLATVGRKFLGAHATKMAEGALTVIAADVGKQLAMSQGINLSGVGFVSPAMIMNRAGQPRLAAVGGVRGAGMYVHGVRGAGMYVRGRGR